MASLYFPAVCEEIGGTDAGWIAKCKEKAEGLAEVEKQMDAANEAGACLGVNSPDGEWHKYTKAQAADCFRDYKPSDGQTFEGLIKAKIGEPKVPPPFRDAEITSAVSVLGKVPTRRVYAGLKLSDERDAVCEIHETSTRTDLKCFAVKPDGGLKDIGSPTGEELQEIEAAGQASAKGVLEAPERQAAVAQIMLKLLALEPSLPENPEDMSLATLIGVKDQVSEIMRDLNVNGRCKRGERVHPISDPVELVEMSVQRACNGLQFSANLADITVTGGLLAADETQLPQQLLLNNDRTLPDVVVTIPGFIQLAVMDINIQKTDKGPAIILPPKP